MCSPSFSHFQAGMSPIRHVELAPVPLPTSYSSRAPKVRRTRRAGGGFTLIEILVVVALIGILAALGLVQLSIMTRRANVSSVASDLRNFRMAFIHYNLEHGSYPNDNNMQVPPGMEHLLDERVFEDPTPLGGNYNWEGPNFYTYAGISLTNATAPADEIEMLDRMLDDGDLNSGAFRIAPNGRPTLIIEDNI